MTYRSITTIGFPDSELRETVMARLSSDARKVLRAVVFSAEHQDDDPAEVQALILPYLSAPKTLALADRLTGLELVQTQTTGYDGVSDAVGSSPAVATAAGVHAGGTAELALALTLASLRGIDEAARDQLTGRWNHVRRPSLQDRRVLMIGVGGIGEEIARRLDPFDVELTRVGRSAREDARGFVHGFAELPDLLPHAEVVILITPLTSETEHLVDAAFLAALPDGALVVNVARGRVVDTEALLAEAGRIRAALDVTDPEPLPEDHPLWSAPGVLITPHVGGDTTAFEPRIEDLLVQQLERIAAGQDPANLVE